MKKILFCPIVLFFLYSKLYSQDCTTKITEVKSDSEPTYFKFATQVKLENQEGKTTMVADGITHNKSIAIFLIMASDNFCPDKGDSVALEFLTGRRVYRQNVLATNCDKKLAIVLGDGHVNDAELDSLMTKDLVSITVFHNGSRFRGHLKDGQETLFKNTLTCLHSALASVTTLPAPLAIDNEPVFLVAERVPQYKDGYEAMALHLAKNMKMPKEKGTVYVNFIVEKDGSVSDVKIMKGLSPKADAEAIRLVKTLSNWIPGEQGGKPVRVRFNLPIRFK